MKQYGHLNSIFFQSVQSDENSKCEFGLCRNDKFHIWEKGFNSVWKYLTKIKEKNMYMHTSYSYCPIRWNFA